MFRASRLFAVVALALAASSLPVLAADADKSKLQPLPAVPPPPPEMAPLDAALQEPQVTIKKDGADTVEEYRVNGQLYMIKITPKSGEPYYLFDERGDGNFARRDLGDTGLRVPRWVIKTF